MTPPRGQYRASGTRLGIFERQAGRLEPSPSIRMSAPFMAGADVPSLAILRSRISS
jgi:hypothetical protein